MGTIVLVVLIAAYLVALGYLVGTGWKLANR